jgi:UDP:flavonoid glycosyltransferase YjiC (YdhE family)
MLGIENKLPLVVAGVHEGKNEINARIGYFKLGVNLKTETPAPEAIKKAIDEVLINEVYRKNVEALATEFKEYDPMELCAKYVKELLHPSVANMRTAYKKVTIPKESLN